MKLFVDSYNDEILFFLQCDKTELNVPKSNYFKYISKLKLWAIKDPFIAKKFIEFADEETVKAINDAIDNYYSQIKLSSALKYNIKVEIPPKEKLKKFQYVAVHWLMSRKNSLLADEQGLGKTIEAIVAINNIKAKKILIICPDIAKIGWNNALKRWLINQDLTIWINNKRKPNYNADIWIINYESVHKYKKEIDKNYWDVLILDECQYIMNNKRKRTRNIVGHKSRKINEKIEPIKAKYKWALTGTPMMNRPKELWTIINYLDPFMWTNWWYYVNRYCDATLTDFGYNYDGASNVEELQYKLRGTIMLRREKKQAMPELPDKIHKEIIFSRDTIKNFDKNELSISNELHKILKDIDFDNLDIKELDNLMKKVKSKLSKNFCELPSIRKNNAISKLPIAINYIKDSLRTENKLVVFAHHRDVVNAIYEEFKDIAVKIQGGMSSSEKYESQNKFQTDDNIKLIVCSITAANMAIDLYAANNIIFVEQDWVPGVMLQAVDRCHRHGQKKFVYIKYLLIENSIDQYIISMMLKKQDLFSKLVSVNNKKVYDLNL